MPTALPFEPPLRATLQIALAALGLGVIAVPPLVVGLSGDASIDTLWTTLRLAALEGFTLVFASVASGAFRPFLVRVMRPRTAQRLHTTTALAGFSITVAHGVLAAVFGIAGYRGGPLWLGPVALALLTLATLAALCRRRFRGSWRWFHRLNYVVFAAALIHGSLIGYDLGAALFLRVCTWVYAGVVAGGIVFRLATPTNRRSQPA